MKKQKCKGVLGLLAAGLLGLWPVGGLRAQAAATMAAAETSAETVKCDTIRMTWEAEAGKWKAISFTGDSGAWYSVDWGDGHTGYVYAKGGKASAEYMYNVSGSYEVLLCGMTGAPVYMETAFGLEMPMAYVQGGTFLMGATSEQGSVYASELDDERPVRRVALSSFYIGKYEVTQAQWAAVMGTTIAQQRDKVGTAEELYGVGDDYPMYYVSWYEANEFCEKLSQKTGKKYRLPTEAEWEYAARGGQNNDGTKYAGSNTIGEVAWYYGNCGRESHPVGQKKPNGSGLYDMSGNVGEWCSDWYYGSYLNASVWNPQGPRSGSGRVARGGYWSYWSSWSHLDGPWGSRVSCRYSKSPGGRSYAMGFRVVCVP